MTPPLALAPPLPAAHRDCGRCLGILGLPLSNSSIQADVAFGIPAPTLAAALRAWAGDAGAASAPEPPCWPDGGPCTHRAAVAAAAPRPALSPAAGGAGLADGRRLADAGTAAAAADAPAAAAASAAAPATPASAPAGAVAWAGVGDALRSVVMVRAGGSWATGVVLPGGRGLVLTNAHLLAPQQLPSAPGQQPQAPSGSASSGSSSALGRDVWVRLPSDFDRESKFDWRRARLLHAFRGHLDLAVLQLAPPPAAGDAGGGVAAAALVPLQLATPGALRRGDSVFVLGHGLFGPRAQAPPAATRGSAASIVRLACGAPSLLITSAAVHGGASGGAVVDGSGALVGLVTSNARHASGDTLPRLNFAVHAAELQPLWAWAAAAGRGTGPVTSASASAAGWLQQLRALDRDDASGRALWALQDPRGPGDGGGGGGDGGGGRPPGAAAEVAARKLRQAGGRPGPSKL